MDATRARKVLEGFEVGVEWPGVYVLGCIDRRVTIYSQQVRALNLAAALVASARVKQDEPVVVVGAGAAGLTCAAGLRHLGAAVTVLEARDEILSLFRGGSARWLHPGVYDWPLPGWDRDRAGLPLLDWEHGSVDAVREQLEAGWATAGEGVDVRCGVQRVVLGRPKDEPRTVTWRPRGRQPTKTVILAVGFGLEDAPLRDERRYWEGDDLDAARVDGNTRRWLVSGCGDGALTDLFRLCLKDFRHDQMLREFTDDERMAAVRAEIERIENDAAIQDKPQKLHDAYAKLEAPWVVKAMQARRRSDEVFLAAPTAYFLTREASALNRFLAGQLYQAGMFEPVDGRVEPVELAEAQVEVRFEDGVTEHFDRVVRRHGPKPALDEHFPKIATAIAETRKERRAKPTFTDQTRERLWVEGVFGPEVRGAARASSSGAELVADAGSATAPRPEPRPLVDTAHSGPNTEAELVTYRDAVRQRYGVNRFIGFTAAFECQLGWEELYVDLLMEKAHGHSKDVRLAEAEAMDAREAEGQKIALDEAFRYAHDNGRRALVMLGDPGSGKTTLLQQVLLRVLDPEQGPASLGLAEGTLAVFVALQDLPKAIEALGANAAFQALMAHAAARRLGGISAEHVGRLLASPRVLYLLDGLDEIPDPKQRAQVSSMIADALEDAPPGHHMLVSSRYAGYSDVKRVHLGNAFLELRLRPLDDEQVEHLVLNWHRAVERRDAQAQGRLSSEEAAQRRAKVLVERIRSSEFAGEDRLQQIARTPLLLTALCLIDRARRLKGDHGLPPDRAAIYQECEEILLDQWQRQARRRMPSLEAEDAGRILQPVAYWLHGEEKRRYARVAELRASVKQGLEVADKSEQSAEGFLRSFTSESGLLTPWGPQHYGFVHLGFQEHLAALHVREGWSRGEAALVQALAGRFGEGWWREVIRLTLAGAEAGLVEGFVRALAQRPEFSQWWRMRLMSLCLRGAEARAAGARALVELLRAPVEVAGAEQQSAALRLLVQQVPGALEAEGDDQWLREHPVEEVRRWWLGRTRWDEVGKTKVDPTSGVELVWIPGGWFTMGSPEDDDWAWDDEKPAHEVELEGFWLGKTVVTNAQYGEYMRAKGGVKEPMYWGDSSYNQAQQPVVGVSWEEAKGYCEWAELSLPTEAQWEYACRAGTTTRYHSGDAEEDLARVGWYRGNREGRLHAVGELEPNGFGLYDMHGNVDEWCEDQWGSYEGAEHQPGDGLRKQPVGDSFRVVRGGVFLDGPRNARSAFRYWNGPGNRFFDVGFRVAQGHSG